MTRRRVTTAVVVALALTAGTGLVAVRHGTPQRRVVAHFTRTVGIHAGSDVRVLGVRVGKVLDVRPEGTTVRVELSYDATYPVPADATAVIVPPSVVSDRYVQLVPAYAGGPVLVDGADLPVQRTVVPLELDEIYRALDEFNRALGPQGANADGALSALIGTARENLDGNGEKLHATLDGLASALSTLAQGRQDLFGTVDNLQQFTSALARSDAQVREFNAQLASVAEQLAAQRDDLAAALRNLATALADVSTFVHANRDELTSNVSALADLTGVLVRQQRAIVDVLDLAPLALSNLNLAYNPRSGTVDTRDNAMGPYDPASFVCSLMVNLVPASQIPQECFQLARMLRDRGVPLTDELNRLLGQGPTAGAGGNPPGAATGGQAPGAAGTPDPGGAVEQPLDRTLGGILKVTP